MLGDVSLKVPTSQSQIQFLAFYFYIIIIKILTRGYVFFLLI